MKMNTPATSLPLSNNVVAQNIGQVTLRRRKESDAEKIAAIGGGIARIRCGGAGRPTDSATEDEERNWLGF